MFREREKLKKRYLERERGIKRNIYKDLERKREKLSFIYIYFYPFFFLSPSSWGPDDDGRTVDGPHHLAKQALVHGVTYGRGGYGAVYVVASGNGGRNKDNCTCVCVCIKHTHT